MWRCVSPRRIWSSLAADPRAPAADARDVGRLVGVTRRALRERRLDRRAGQDPGLPVGLEAPGVDVLLDRLFRERELDREGGPVVARPGQPQPAVFRGRGGDLHREATGRERNQRRLAPTSFGHGGDVRLPVLHARHRLEQPHHEVDAAAIVDGEVRRARAKVSWHSALRSSATLSRRRGLRRRREQRLDLGLRRRPSAVGARDADLDRALRVEHRSGLALLVDQPAVVLAPTSTRRSRTPPTPGPRESTATDGRASKKSLSATVMSAPGSPSRTTATDDVVVAALVGVPEHVGVPLRVDRDRRRPVVGVGRGESQLGRP